LNQILVCLKAATDFTTRSERGLATRAAPCGSFWENPACHSRIHERARSDVRGLLSQLYSDAGNSRGIHFRGASGLFGASILDEVGRFLGCSGPHRSVKLLHCQCSFQKFQMSHKIEAWKYICMQVTII
jgi:hypothetical protein